MAIKTKAWTLGDGVITGSIFLRPAIGSEPDRLNYTPLGPYYAAVIADGATGYWRMDDGPGSNTVRNEVASSPAGAAAAALWTGGEGPHIGSFRKIYSSRFEGNINDKFIVPFYSGVDFQSSLPFSVEFWFNKNVNGAATGTVIHQGPASTDGMRIRYAGVSDRWEFLLQSTTSTSFVRKYFDTPRIYDETADVWEHYVAVYNPAIAGQHFDSLSFAINGALATATTESGDLDALSQTFENASDMGIGGHNITTNETMAGHLSDVSVYRGIALNSTQIANHYSQYNATGSETAEVKFSYTLPALDFPYGGEIKMVCLPGALGRYESNSAGQYHTRTFVVIDGGSEVEVRPNELIGSGLQISAGGTVDLITRFYSDATFDSGLGANVYELASGDGPTMYIDNQVSSATASGVQWQAPPLGRPNQYVRSDRG